MAAAQPDIFSGQDFSLLRDKNRFVLPPQFRRTLRALNNDTPSMLLLMHDEWPCLVGFAHSRVQQLEAEIDAEADLAARAGREFDREERSLELYAYEPVPFDNSGRFVLPETLAIPAEIEDQVFFRGGGKFFTIWAPHQLETMDDVKIWKNAKIVCRALAKKALEKAGK
ncbi:MAG: division/cell wall cluster transcriptional repressor MraZ [Novosphingobium sp.]|nr:division/cell wall cluster transcriptional repressor MraZ [Novosphingobium sp.]